MSVDPTQRSGVASLLVASLSPDLPTRRGAETELAAGESQPGFSLLLLSLVEDANVPGGGPVRLAAALYFKNLCRRAWGEEEDLNLICEPDRAAIKAQLVPLMIALSRTTEGSTQAAPSLRVQVGEAVSIIAEKDFPDRWDNLIDMLLSNLSPDDYGVNVGVLDTAHSIFRRWRSMFRSDALYSEILFVLSKFCEPYGELLRRTDALLSEPSTPAHQLPLISNAMYLLLQIFYDLNSQDLPPFFEDNHSALMAILRKYLAFARPELVSDPDEAAPGPLENIRSAVCEIAELYTQRYLDVFGEKELPLFVQDVWQMLIGLGKGAEEAGSEPIPKDDLLVSKAMRFLSSVVRLPSQRHLFQDDATLERFCEAIVLPNMKFRTLDEELFEDDPIEFIRRDLEPSTESDTRRKAATDFTQALMEQFEGQVTNIVGRYIRLYLQQYNASPAANWKQKDTAIYLLTSIAARGSTATQGVTSTNVGVDVVKFFSDNVFADLQGTGDATTPILVVDAIKYLHTFRNQLTKDQLLSVLPLLVHHLESPNYVVCSYAAITIERVLFIKQGGQLLFAQADVRPFANNILMALFKKIEQGRTPEKIAENDYLMKCVMRVIVTARQTLLPVFSDVLSHLVSIVTEISKNPSNPKFNQFTFESISALIRFVASTNADAVPEFEAALMPSFQTILTSDTVEFAPYVFQILSQLLELRGSGELPPLYMSILPPLLTPQPWEQRGNVPALVRLLRAFLVRGADRFVANNQVQSLLGIYQRLISSRINDTFGFELLQALFEFLPLSGLQPFLKTIFMLLLNRLQTAKTDKFTKGFIYFNAYILAIRRDGFDPDFLVGIYESIQPGLFQQILQGIVLPELQKLPERDRKVVIVGFARLLTQGNSMLQEPRVRAWPQTLQALVQLCRQPRQLTKNDQAAAEEIFLDFDETEFQASFVKLGASVTAQADPAAWAGDDPTKFLNASLAEASRAMPNVIPTLLEAADYRV